MLLPFIDHFDDSQAMKASWECVDIDLVLLLRERGCSPRQSDHLVQHGPGQGRRHGAGGEDREGPEEDSGGEQHQQQHGQLQEVTESAQHLQGKTNN